MLSYIAKWNKTLIPVAATIAMCMLGVAAFSQECKVSSKGSCSQEGAHCNIGNGSIGRCVSVRQEHDCECDGGPPAIPDHSTAPYGRFIDPVYEMGCSDEASCETESNRYLQAIGILDAKGQPTSDRGTSAAWKASLGFSKDPTHPAPGELRAVYWNNGDLALGRDMHCIVKHGSTGSGRIKTQVSTTYACYVTNFRKDVTIPNVTPVNPFSVPPDIQASISQAAANKSPIATVAMQFSVTALPAARGQKPVTVNSNVEFFAFNETLGGIAFNNPVLDTEGNKALPGNCMACHGGSYGSSPPQVKSGNFLPFDTSSYIYSTDPSFPQLSEVAQREQFRQLNAFVLSTQTTPPITPPVAALINGWYGWCGGVSTVGCFIDDVGNAFVPSGPCGVTAQPTYETCGWQEGGAAAVTLYKNVVAKYCRTCHISQLVNDVESFSQWSSIKTQSLVDHDKAPGNDHAMPYAEVPYNAFWSNQQAQQLFDAFFKSLP